MIGLKGLIYYGFVADPNYLSLSITRRTCVEIGERVNLTKTVSSAVGKTNLQILISKLNFY